LCWWRGGRGGRGRGWLVILFVFVGGHDESFKGGNVRGRMGSSSLAGRRGIGQVGGATRVIAGVSQGCHFRVIPQGHGQTFAPMRDGPMGHFAIVAHECMKLHTHRPKPMPLLTPTIRTHTIRCQFRQLLHILLRLCRIHQRHDQYLLYYSLLTGYILYNNVVVGIPIRFIVGGSAHIDPVSCLGAGTFFNRIK
jgi:hypothetical protein